MIGIGQIKDNVYRMSDTQFIVINDSGKQYFLDFTFLPNKLIVEKIYCNIDKLDEDEINDILDYNAWIYDKEKKCIKIDRKYRKEIVAVDKDVIKFSILKLCHLSDLYCKKIKEIDFNSHTDMNSLLNEYGIEDCFLYDDYAYYDPKLNGYEGYTPYEKHL